MKQGEFLGRTYWIGLRLSAECLLSGCYAVAVPLSHPANIEVERLGMLQVSASHSG